MTEYPNRTVSFLLGTFQESYLGPHIILMLLMNHHLIILMIHGQWHEGQPSPKYQTSSRGPVLHPSHYCIMCTTYDPQCILPGRSSWTFLLVRSEVSLQFQSTWSVQGLCGLLCVWRVLLVWFREFQIHSNLLTPDENQIDPRTPRPPLLIFIMTCPPTGIRSSFLG